MKVGLFSDAVEALKNAGAQPVTASRHSGACAINTSCHARAGGHPDSGRLWIPASAE